MLARDDNAKKIVQLITYFLWIGFVLFAFNLIVPVTQLRIVP